MYRQSWRNQGSDYRESCNWPGDYAPLGSRPNIVSAKALTPRAMDIVHLGWATRLRWNASQQPRLTEDELMKDFFSDFSQSLQRKPWGNVSCLKRSSKYDSYEYDAVLRGEHHLRIQGFPKRLLLGDMPDSSLRDLAGESFAARSVGAVFWAFFVIRSMPWWQQAD